MSRQLQWLHVTGQLDKTSSILQPSHCFFSAHAQFFLLEIQETEEISNLLSVSTHQGYLVFGERDGGDEGIDDGNIDCPVDWISEFLSQRNFVGDDDGISVCAIDGKDDGENVTFDIEGV